MLCKKKKKKKKKKKSKEDRVNKSVFSKVEK